MVPFCRPIFSGTFQYQYSLIPSLPLCSPLFPSPLLSSLSSCFLLTSLPLFSSLSHISVYVCMCVFICNMYVCIGIYIKTYVYTWTISSISKITINMFYHISYLFKQTKPKICLYYITLKAIACCFFSAITRSKEISMLPSARVYLLLLSHFPLTSTLLLSKETYTKSLNISMSLCSVGNFQLSSNVTFQHHLMMLSISFLKLLPPLPFLTSYYSAFILPMCFLLFLVRPNFFCLL